LDIVVNNAGTGCYGECFRNFHIFTQSMSCKDRRWKYRLNRSRLPLRRTSFRFSA
jgi:hypothetical protein